MTKTSLFSIAIAVFVTASLAIVIWGFDKGFSISDGGFYVLRYQQNQANGPCDFAYDHILVKAIIPPAWRTIKSLRYIRFGLALLSTLLFSLAIAKLYRKVHGASISRSMLLLVMLAAVVVSFTGMPVELSYNTLTQFFLISSTAFIVLSLTYEGVFSITMAALAGFACSALYLTKLPSGLAMTLFSVFVLLISGSSRWRRTIMFLGAGCVSLFAFNYILDPGFVTQYYCAFLNRGGAGTIHNSSLFLKSILDAALMFLKTVAVAIPIIVAFWMANLKRKHKVLQSVYWSIGLFISSLYLFAQITDHLLGFYVLSQFFLMAICLMIVAWILQACKFQSSEVDLNNSLKIMRPLLPFLLLLLAVPYIGALGSAIPLDRISKFYYVTFMGLIVVLMPILKHKHTSLMITCFSLYLVFIGMYHYVQYPFGFGPLYTQTETYKGIKYDPESFKFYTQTDIILKKHGFKKTQGLLVAYASPGLVYLMDSFQPGGVLWKEERQEEYFRRLKKSPLKFQPVLISLSSEPSEKFVTGFNTATGLDFERDYRLLDKYKSYDGFSTAHVYFPISTEMPGTSSK